MRIVVIAALLVGCSANDDIPAPMISAVVPSRAPAGAVMITGDYFCQLPDVDEEDPVCENTGSVQFGTTPGTSADRYDDHGRGSARRAR